MTYRYDPAFAQGYQQSMNDLVTKLIDEGELAMWQWMIDNSVNGLVRDAALRHLKIAEKRNS